VHDEMMGSFLIILLVVGGIILFVKALNWEHQKKDKKKDKTLRQEVDKIFEDLKKNADIFDREEFKQPLDVAKSKIMDILDENDLLNYKS
jgi:hypothetical protein